MTDTPALSFIGTIETSGDSFEIRLDHAYTAGLLRLSAFSHAHVLWWADGAATPAGREQLVCKRPYTRSDADVGVFASRSPERPNPIGMSVVALMSVDEREGRLAVPFIDALPGTPVIDIKPYFPASDRVLNTRVPAWFAAWPDSYEASAAFDWSSEFR